MPTFARLMSVSIAVACARVWCVCLGGRADDLSFCLGSRTAEDDDSVLTLLAVAENARRWTAAPRTDCETFRAANMATVGGDDMLGIKKQKFGGSMDYGRESLEH